MLSALSSKVAENELIVLDELKFDAPKTKEMVKVLENVKAEKESSDRYWLKRTKTSYAPQQHLQGIRTALVTTMNVYEIINHTNLIVTKEAIEKIEEVYA